MRAMAGIVASVFSRCEVELHAFQLSWSNRVHWKSQ